MTGYGSSLAVARRVAVTIALALSAIGFGGGLAGIDSARAGSFELGVSAYEQGNYFRAVQHWRPLAETGNLKAQTALGLAYYHGQGVPQDFGEAAVWYRRAAEQGYPYAQGLLGYLYFLGQGVLQDYIESYLWLNLAVAGLPPGRERDLTISRRGVTQTQLSTRELHEAQQRASQWRPAPAVPEDVQ